MYLLTVAHIAIITAKKDNPGWFADTTQTEQEFYHDPVSGGVSPMFNNAISVPNPSGSEPLELFQNITNCRDGEIWFLNLTWWFNFVESVTGEKLELKTITTDCFSGIADAFNRLINGDCFGTERAELIDFICWGFKYMAGQTSWMPKLLLRQCWRHVKMNVIDHFKYHNLNTDMPKYKQSLVGQIATYTISKMRTAPLKEAVQHASLFIFAIG